MSYRQNLDLKMEFYIPPPLHYFKSFRTVFIAKSEMYFTRAYRKCYNGK